MYHPHRLMTLCVHLIHVSQWLGALVLVTHLVRSSRCWKKKKKKKKKRERKEREREEGKGEGGRKIVIHEVYI